MKNFSYSRPCMCLYVSWYKQFQYIIYPFSCVHSYMNSCIWTKSTFLTSKILSVKVLLPPVCTNREFPRTPRNFEPIQALIMMTSPEKEISNQRTLTEKRRLLQERTIKKSMMRMKYIIMTTIMVMLTCEYCIDAVYFHIFIVIVYIQIFVFPY